MPGGGCIHPHGTGAGSDVSGAAAAAPWLRPSTVYPSNLLPPHHLTQELQEPAFAHAGMVAAAKAIFADMTERGLLQEVRSTRFPPPHPITRGNPVWPAFPTNGCSCCQKHTCCAHLLSCLLSCPALAPARSPQLTDGVPPSLTCHRPAAGGGGGGGRLLGAGAAAGGTRRQSRRRPPAIAVRRRRRVQRCWRHVLRAGSHAWGQGRRLRRRRCPPASACGRRRRQRQRQRCRGAAGGGQWSGRRQRRLSHLGHQPAVRAAGRRYGAAVGGHQRQRRPQRPRCLRGAAGDARPLALAPPRRPARSGAASGAVAGAASGGDNAAED